MADRDDCLYSMEASVAGLLAALDPHVALATGCDVKRSPDACPECVMNNDCNRIPVHDNCRCEAEPFLLGAND